MLMINLTPEEECVHSLCVCVCVCVSAKLLPADQQGPVQGPVERCAGQPAERQVWISGSLFLLFASLMLNILENSHVIVNLIWK